MIAELSIGPPTLQTKASPQTFPFLKRAAGTNDQKGFSANIPNAVRRDSHQQYDPPNGQLNSHPEFPSLEAPHLRENFGTGDEHNMDAKNLSQYSEDPVDRSDSVESFFQDASEDEATRLSEGMAT